MPAGVVDPERRQASRYRLQLPVVLTWADDQQTHTQAGFTHDVSVVGLFVTCSSVPPVRTLVNVELLLPRFGQMPENTIKALGYVVRTFGSSKPHGIAIAAKLSKDFTPEENLGSVSWL